MTTTKHNDRINALHRAIGERILILDGAMGTMIQKASLSEADFHLADHEPSRDKLLTGCNDILVLTRPDVIKEIHLAYIKAGADIIETCSFNANALSMAEYALVDKVREINIAAAILAREAASSVNRPVWVAGSIGPTGKSLTMAINLGDDIDFDTMEQAYYEQVSALIEGGVDLLLMETIFDTLNAKAAIHAAMRAMDDTGIKVPVITSATLTESGRTLSGQSLDAFVVSVSHAHPLAVSLNCGFGAEALVPYIESLAHVPCAVALYPNAGLPDKMGQYTETPDMMVEALKPLFFSRALNIVGGCCGTTPAHIAALAAEAKKYRPRYIPAPSHVTRLAGLDTLTITPESNLINIGERCNVAGSRKFLRLISENNIDEAVEVAASQVEKGAQAVDINMDDGMLDAADCMKRFVSRLQVEPVIARVPMVIDSSDWNVILSGLKCVQGKPLVNSISLKEGEEVFLQHAREINRLGGAMVVMAFDEKGQATTLPRRIEICTRAYNLLTTRADIDPCDIIFDANILTIATGIAEHDNYAVDFIETVREIKRTLPYAGTGGGVSNLSFAFRGHNYLREAMHAVFLYHAVKAGLDTAIVNAAALMPVDDIEPDLREAIEDVIFNRRTDAVERLTEFATRIKEAKSGDAKTERQATETLTPDRLLRQLIIKGSTAGLQEVLDEVGAMFPRAVDIIDGPLMDAMDRVGQMFGDGRMFLPQVVKSATVMKEAVAILQPRLDCELADGTGTADRHRIVLATVKGDVHDIGKNIVGIIMKCNGWEVIDLGVMVPPDRIVRAAIEHGADAIGLSGLITPSLEEMRRTAALLRENGVRIPLFIGGATTSSLHTAVKIAPEYDGLTVHTRDAATIPVIAGRLMSPATAGAEKENIIIEQKRLRQESARPSETALLPLDEARKIAFKSIGYGSLLQHPATGELNIGYTPRELHDIINRKALLAAWKLDPAHPETPQAAGLLHDMEQMLDRLQAAGYHVNARAVTMPAVPTGNDCLRVGDLTLPFLRRQHPDKNGATLCISDFVNPDGTDVVTLFTVTAPAPVGIDVTSDYDRLLLESLLHRLAEAGTELLHRQLGNGERTGIRPAAGYPMIPDQSIVRLFDELLRYDELDITVTENGALHPSATTTGIIIYNPEARYFEIGTIGQDQLDDYACRRGMSVSDLRPYLSAVLL